MDAVKKIEGVQEALDKRRESNICHCTQCEKKIADTGHLACDVCGFKGPQVALACSCIYERCQVGAMNGCCHGDLVCPACSDGNNDDPWAVVREVRKVLSDD